MTVPDVLLAGGGAASAPGHLVFVVTPERVDGGGIAVRARNVLARRSAAGTWPVGNNASKARKFAMGRVCCSTPQVPAILTAPPFIGVGEVAGPLVAVARPRRGVPSWERVVRTWVDGTFELPIRKVHLFTRPVSVVPLVPVLEFFSNMERWSTRLAGAFHRISEADFARVLRVASEADGGT